MIVRKFHAWRKNTSMASPRPGGVPVPRARIAADTMARMFSSRGPLLGMLMVAGVGCANRPATLEGADAGRDDASIDAGSYDGAVDGPEVSPLPCAPALGLPYMAPVASLAVHSGCGEARTDDNTGEVSWVQPCEGVAEACVRVPTDGRYEIDVAAFGDGSAPPTLQIGIDGVYSDQRMVAVEWSAPTPPLSTYLSLAHLTAGPHRIELRRGAGPGGALFLESLAVSAPPPPPAPDAGPDEYWSDVPLTWYPVDNLDAPIPRQALATDKEAPEPTVHVGAVGMPRSGDALSWAFNSNGYAETTVVFPNDGPYDFDVWAYGDTFVRPPQMQVAIDGEPIGSVEVPASTLTKYSFHAANVTAGAHLVEVSFPNDLLGSGDRNLVVNAVDITEPGAASEERIDNGVGGQIGVGVYQYGPDSAGPAMGKWFGIDWTTHTSTVTFSASTVFPNTTRNVYVYVPTAVDASTPTAFMVFQDGLSYCSGMSNVFDHLIAEKAMPPTIAICASPGSLSVSTASCAAGDDDCERSFEYDSVDDRYFQFVVNDLLPFASNLAGVTLTADPEQRGIGGGSSGGIAAFTVGWLHPESFRKIYTSSASFADIRHHGGDQYPAMIRARSETLPLRITMVAGTHDFDCFGNVAPNCGGDPHAWADANKRVAAALHAKGYPYRFQFGSETHVGALANTTEPDDLRWLWSK
ncbi:MAG: hypothetical protein LC797_21100 [Chloroflexi bacterium]|nr:hypothetical protein [Chloroflexota bacterium]